MGRLIFFLLLAGAVYLLIEEMGLGSSNVRVENDQVVVDADQIEGRFQRAGDFSETFMIFGGVSGQLKNSLFDVGLAALDVRDARSIKASYPDFHMCHSPGAPKAQRLIQELNLLGADRGARKTLLKAIDLHQERVGGGGERTCLSVSGQRLTLASVRLKEQDIDITGDIVPKMKGQKFYLAETAEIQDCSTLL